MSYLALKGTEESILNLIKPFGFDVCPICHEIVIYNSYVAVCGHKFCNKCIKKLMIDCGTLKRIKNVYDNNDINDNNDSDDSDDSDDNYNDECANCNSSQYIQEYKCPLCRKILINMPLRLSETDLDYKKYSCIGTKCGKKRFTLKEFEEHVFYKCPDRKILCKEVDEVIDCKEEIKISQFRDHFDRHLEIRNCLHAFLYKNRICSKCGYVVINSVINV